MERLNCLVEEFYATPEICPERALLVTESYKETEGMPEIIRRARAFERVLLNKSIYILPEELIVGSLTNKIGGAPVYPEFGMSWIIREMDTFEQRPFDQFVITSETKEVLRELFMYWDGKTHEDRTTRLANHILPPEVRQEGIWDEISFDINSVVHGGSKRADGDGHLTVSHEKVIRRGFLGIIEDVHNAQQQLAFNDREYVKKKLFYEAVLICCNAAIKFAERHAELASSLAMRYEENSRRRRELEMIAKVCKRVPAHPATSFWEAVQATWFTHLLLWLESNGHSLAVGRLDQYLYPYFVKDIRKGNLTRGEALELIGCLMAKVGSIKKLRPWSETQHLGGRPTFQAITIGGQDSHGQDATNELSYVILEANAKLRLPEPVVVCRVHSRSPNEFLQAAVNSLKEHRGGLPAFFSDEVIIPALTGVGVTLEDARDYAIVACSEPTVPGKTLSHTGGVTYLNILKVLELALYGGKNPENGSCLHPHDKELGSFESFEDVMVAFQHQLRCYLQYVPLFSSMISEMFAQYIPVPYTSALLNHRIEIGKDMTEGGGPNYNDTQINLYGVPNVGNSLMALKKCVFDDGSISQDELKQALLSNFDGPEGARIRRILLDAPKYGNDAAEVDGLTARVLQIIVEEVKRLNPPWRGGVYGVSLQTTTGNVPAGEQVGATPDGRMSQEALADNISAHPGTDRNGITALLNSASRLDHASCKNISIFNVKLHPSAVAGEEGVYKIADLIRIYLCDLRGAQIQFNIITADELRAAQKAPDEYRSLVVKVAGYSAQFISLDKRLQDQLIARTEYR